MCKNVEFPPIKHGETLNVTTQVTLDAGKMLDFKVLKVEKEKANKVNSSVKQGDYV